MDKAQLERLLKHFTPLQKREIRQCHKELSKEDFREWLTANLPVMATQAVMRSIPKIRQ